MERREEEEEEDEKRRARRWRRKKRRRRSSLSSQQTDGSCTQILAGELENLLRKNDTLIGRPVLRAGATGRARISWWRRATRAGRRLLGVVVDGGE